MGLLHAPLGAASDGSWSGGAGGITSAAPIMFPLESIHQIVATDPRAQATLFLLMTELHYRLIQELERLHVGRVASTSPWASQPGTTAGSAPKMQ